MNAALVVARAVHFGAAMLVFGELVFVAFVAGKAWRRGIDATPVEGAKLDRHVFAFAAWALAAGALSGLAWLIVEAADMSGAAIGQVPGTGTIGVVLRETEFGHVFVLRSILWLALAVALVRLRRATADVTAPRGIALAIAALYLATLAGAGHASGATAGAVRVVHVGADALHLLGAGAWLGALPPLVYCIGHAPSNAALARLAHRFSALGIACVALLIASGIVNSLFLVGSFAALFGTAYGQLLIVKLAVFAAMLVLAATNRFLLTPRVAAGNLSSQRSLRRNARLEIAGGITIVTLVGVLGTMIPGAHQMPVWPFDFALDFAGSNLSRRAIGALGGAALLALAALALIIIGVRRKSMRVWLPGWVALLVSAVASTSIFAVPAYPTTFATPPVPYAVDAVARGAAAFAHDCSGCHGTDARGNGAATAALSRKPANLATHALHHPLGNLFWWTAHGIPGTPMPAFSSQIPETGIWEIVQFLVARASAESAMSLRERVDSGSMSRAPDFTYEVAGQGQQTLWGHRTPALIVLYSLPQSETRLSQLLSDHRLMHANVRVIAFPLSPSPSPDGRNAGQQTVVSRDAATAYAMFAGAKTHAELLVDAAGIVRARWDGVPPQGIDRDASIIDAAQSLPAPSQMPASAMHHGH